MGIRILKRGRISCVAVLFVLVLAAGCGGTQEAAGQGSGRSGGDPVSENQPDGTTMAETTGGIPGEAAELARAEVGGKEIQNMLPADGKAPDPARPLPQDPPEGIEVYPATTNRTTREPLSYPRTPPTNGDHDPLWQNCGFYKEPIKDRHAVHSMDHGVVWITHQPDLPRGGIEDLRSYGDENYVIVSPYPGQSAPVTVTSWRVQLELEDADDPRLRQFVDGFRRSELAPLSGNRCTLGVGAPG